MEEIRDREIERRMMRGEEGEVVLMEEEREEEVNWHRYLPNMPVKVLLVEGDDSTRQIISALLRKCSYRVVAVADGMKAWEILKEKPNSIDLVLTEVELPCLSGFGLLTMIMEHDICKNIPVIMMSSHDSISMVFKCMLKGAADFLVKPVRKNELGNLWQHVWRRQIASGGAGAMQGSQEVNLSNVEMGDKINIEKLSGGNENATILEKSNELSEQRSDAQSSCTRSDVEAESKHNTQNTNLDLSMNMSAQSMVADAKVSPRTVDRSKHVGSGSDARQNEEHLELSLRRFEYRAPSHEQKENDKRNKLNHSNSSPFSQYNCKLKINPAVATEFTECIPTLSNLNLTSDDLVRSPATTQVQEKPALPSNPIKSVPVPVPTGGFPLDQLFNNSVPLDQVREIEEDEEEEDEEMTIDPVSRDPPPTEENNNNNNKEMSSKGVSETSSSVSVSNVGPAAIVNNNFHNACIGGTNNEGLRCLTQREIALNKFRLKRKERCFEKKVRYQSRKILAEKRPRVKGQFVRQDQMVQEAGAIHAAK